jgi:hypothetical protein
VDLPSLFVGAVVLLATAAMALLLLPPFQATASSSIEAAEPRPHIIYSDGAGGDALSWIVQSGGGGAKHSQMLYKLTFWDHCYFYPGLRVSLLNVLIYLNTTHSLDLIFVGLKAVGECEQNPLLYYDYNVVGTINLLEVMAAHRCKKVSTITIMLVCCLN